MATNGAASTAEQLWCYEPPSPEAVRRLREALDVSDVLAQALARRGLGQPECASRFLGRAYQPADSSLLPGLGEAVAALRLARRSKRRVAVYGDYDVDGVVATVVLRDALRRFGLAPGGRRSKAEVPFHIPNRAVEGYGLNEEAVVKLAGSGVELLITVDCGISARPEVELASRLGMGVVVTDHHRPPADLPPAVAIVDPWLPGSHYPEPDLCGAQVALKLAQALLGETREDWLDLAALATVADVVPLLGENRGLVSERLPRLRHTKNLGLRSLIEVSGLGGRELDSRHLAFVLGPRINALGRVGDASEAVLALSAPTPVEAIALATKMDQANLLRQTIEAAMCERARAQVAADCERRGAPPAALVVSGRGWEHGVVGIVAGRLAREYWRPAAVVSLEDGQGRGSARSVPGFDIYAALTECQDLLLAYGGHAQAAGFRLAESRLGAFAQRLEALAAERAPEPRRLELDAAVSLEQVNEDLVREVARLGPFGESNPEPALGLFGAQVARAWSIGGGQHLKMVVRQGRLTAEAVAFGQAGELGAVCREGALVDLAFTPELNEFRGRRNVRLRVVDVRPAGEGASAAERQAAERRAAVGQGHAAGGERTS